MHTEEYERRVRQRLAHALAVIGAAGVGWASDQLRANGSVVTSNLVNSVTYATKEVQGTVKGKTTGTPITAPDSDLAVKIGSNVVYAARVEMGFVGRDSLGRLYNQPPKSYLRVAIMKHKDKIIDILKRVNG